MNPYAELGFDFLALFGEACVFFALCWLIAKQLDNWSIVDVAWSFGFALVGLQVLVWVCGGVLFSIVPFTAWVKGGDTVKPPAVQLPADSVSSQIDYEAELAVIIGTRARRVRKQDALRHVFIVTPPPYSAEKLPHRSLWSIE